MSFNIHFLTLWARFFERQGIAGVVWNLEDMVFKGYGLIGVVD